MKKKYKNIIIGSGFSAFVLNFFLNKEALIITTSVNLLKGYPKRNNLTYYLKLFSIKFSSFGNYSFNLYNSNLHDTLIHGGNTNFWGGICNIKKIKAPAEKLKSVMSFKKISINKTGSVSNDQYLNQMQKKDSRDGSIFNCSKYFKKKIYGHLVKFKCINKETVEIKVKKKNKIEKFFCKNLILAVNTTQLLEILINSNILKDEDYISLDEHKFETKVSVNKNLKFKLNQATFITYSISGIIKHALGLQKNFNRYLFQLFNYLPFYYHQIFYKKKIKAIYKVNEKNKNITEVKLKTNKNFGNSIHYFNMKINNKKLEKKIKFFNKRVFGVSSPFIEYAEAGPISNFLINQSYNLAKKLNNK